LTTYYVDVRAVGNGGAATAYFTVGSTATLPSQTPGNVKVTAVSQAYLVLGWSAVGSSGGYELDASTSANFSGALYSSRTANGNATTLETPSVLSYNTTYYLRVGALWGGTTVYASAASTSTLAMYPGPLPVTAVSSSSLQANWSLNGDPAWTAFLLVLSTGPNPGSNRYGGNVAALTTGTWTAFSGLSAQTTYYMAGAAVNNNGVMSSYLNFTATMTLSASGGSMAKSALGLAAAGAAPDAGAFELGQVYAFPNPARRGANVTLHVEAGLADGLDIAIYDISGRLVASQSISGAPGLIDDHSGCGPRYAYEWTWNVEGIPSGVYIYAAQAHKAGRADLRTMKKVAVIK
jgi:hypothetical protein